MSDNCPDEIELHRPYIDAVTIKCPDCGKEMHRVPEVIDCWFDSGSMPFAQHHYPFENKDLFEQQFPADFISESVATEKRICLPSGVMSLIDTGW